jgi:hypothetical protein
MFGFFKVLTESLFGDRFDDSKLNEDIAREVAKEHNISPEELDTNIRYRPLPVIHYIKRVGNKIYHTVGKIMGFYDPDTKDVTIDINLRRRLGSGLDSLKAYVSTVAEEISHRAQHYLGKLNLSMTPDEYFDNYDTNPNEVEAKRVADRVTDRIVGKYYGGGYSGGALSMY